MPKLQWSGQGLPLNQFRPLGMKHQIFDIMRMSWGRGAHLASVDRFKVLPEARNTFDLTRARLWKVQGKVVELRPLFQALKKRDNHRPDQQRVLAWLERGF